MPRITVALWFAATALCIAQSQDPPVSLDASVGASIAIADGSFSSVPGIPSPGPLQFQPQTGSVLPRFSIGADIPLAQRFRFGARIGLSTSDLSYVANERVPIATRNGELYLATVEHKMSTSFSTIDLAPRIRYNVLDNLALEAGIPVYIPIASSYLQTQRFTDPAGLQFVDGRTEQETGQGVVPELRALTLGVRLRAEGILPITRSGSLSLIPHVEVTQMFMAPNASGAFQSLQISIGIGLRHDFFETPVSEPPPVLPLKAVSRDTVIAGADTTVVLRPGIGESRIEFLGVKSDSTVTDTSVTLVMRPQYLQVLPKPPTVLKGSLRLSFVQGDGAISDDARITVSRLKLTRTVPILPLVIFDEAKAEIPSRYQTLSTASAKTWKGKQAITASDVHWQYHVLNVVGDRMRGSSARCSLSTYYDGTENGKTLALDRLNKVKQYLVQTFGIAERRFILDVEGGQASQPGWVLIADPSRTLLKPLTASLLSSETSMPRVQVNTEVISEEGIKAWTITMTQGGKTIRTFKGAGSVPQEIMWDMNDDLAVDAQAVQQILAELNLEGDDGTTARSEPGRIVVRTQAVIDASGIQAERTEVLRTMPPEYLKTPDAELIGPADKFTKIEFYPASESDVAESQLAAVPRTTKLVGANVWFRKGLAEPELELYRRAELYIRDSRDR